MKQIWGFRMRKVNLVQGSKEWLDWRQGGIGASEISVLMGSNPYKTPLQLWEVKCGFRSEDATNAAMQHGKDNEDVALSTINNKYGLLLSSMCVEDEEKPHYKASFDAYDEVNEVLHEIKCPVSIKTLDMAIHEQKTNAYWVDQVLWQSRFCKPKKSVLSIWDYRTRETTDILIPPDEERVKEMELAADKFWQCVQLGVQPDPQKGDYLEVEDEKLRELLITYQKYGEEEKFAKLKKEAIKNQICEFGDDGNFKAYGFKILRMMPPGSYNLKKMKEDGIDIEKYKKKSNTIGFYRIFPPKT